MSRPSSLAEFAASRGLTAEGVVDFVRTTVACDAQRQLDTHAAARAVAQAVADNGLYVGVFGARRAAHDVPVPRPALLASPPVATALTESEADELYESVFGKGA
jgi:hypothetical protein